MPDTGPGVPPEHLPRVFDRFYRAEEARTRKGGGTGLGLAIARDLALGQGGDLLGENAPDGGVRFTLALPAGSRTKNLLRAESRTPGAARASPTFYENPTNPTPKRETA